MDRRDIARKAASAAGRARRARQESQAEEPAKPADDKKEESSGADVKAAAATAVANAARGAMTGGAAGAVKGVAIGAIRDKNTRKIILGIVAVVLGLILIVGMAILNSISGASVALIQGQDDTNSVQSAREAGVDDETMQQVQSTEHSNLPWQVQAAALDTYPEAKLGALEDKLDELDPSREYRDFTIYASRSAHSPTLVQQVDQNPGKDYYAKNEEIHLEAFNAAGMNDSEAEDAYALTVQIMLGVDGCVPPGDEPPGGDDDSFEYENVTYDAGQVANMKTVIGLAKTMFPSTWEEASLIGLITVSLESTFQNYANDGVVGPEDDNMGAYTADDYAKLAYSLEIPHDAVGSDHASVGLLQQQATYWGHLPDSTFDSDPEGVIDRLMEPAFAAGLFYKRLADVSDWSDRDPGEVAQEIQVSDTPDAYQHQVPLAEAIIDEYAADQEGISVPNDVGWNGEDNSGDGDGDGNVTDECGETTPGGGGNVPTGDEQELAQQILAAGDEGKILWWAPDPEGFDQIVAYSNGDPIPDACTLDKRVLQLLLMTTEEFNKMSINSLNRRCTNNHAGIGEASAHWRGQAGDIGNLNGKYTTDDPAIPEAYQWWDMFAAVAVDSGAGLGQSQCRTTTYPGIVGYYDPCNHLHFEIGRDGNTEPLK